MGRLDGHVSLITGGTSGIGRRTVERFVDEGAVVVFTGRREDKAVELVSSLGSESVAFVRADVMIEDDIADAAIYLASDESKFVNGVDLVVDGGAIVGRGWTEAVSGMGSIAKTLRA